MSNLLPGVPLIESPFFAKEVATANLEASTRSMAISLAAKGYAIIDFPEPEISNIAESVKATMAPKFDLDEWRASGNETGASLRIQDAWNEFGDAWRIACNRPMLELLSKLYGRKAWPFQTLTFPVATQQKVQPDVNHFHSSPERFLCGVLVALEDIDASNGPIVVYPGSHKWPVYTNEQLGKCSADPAHAPSQALYESVSAALIEAHHAKPEVIHLKKGQALIWAANLMHGTEKQTDINRTRWTQVTHYFFEGCSYYTPMLSDPFHGNIAFRTLRNIESGQMMEHSYAGHTIPPDFVRAASGSHHWDVQFRFDPAEYLKANPDVLESGMNPYEHYMKHGRAEKRKLKV